VDNTTLLGKSNQFKRGRRWAYFSYLWLLSMPFIGMNTAFAQEAKPKADDVIPYPVVATPDTEKGKQIKLGEYLVKASDCIACHTKPGGKPYAGGLPFKTPFGTIYSPNITPDKDSGIGAWNDKDFIKAMKHGVGPDGSYYFPVFPYTSFTKMTDADVLAIKAYLDVIPPVVQANLQPDMPIPFRWRFGQFFWRTLFFSEGEYQPDETQSAEWNRGAYLVQGPGHCGMCHTPLNFLGAPKHRYDLAGGAVEGFVAPGINEKALANVPVSEILDVFLKDHRIGGGTLSAKPMLEVNHNSLSLLTKEDLTAIATYLKTVKSETPPREDLGGGSAAEAGKNIYEKYCQACHTTGSGGSPKLGDAAAWAPRVKDGIDKVYQKAITGFGGMPPKGTCMTCTDEDIHHAVDYIIAQSGGAAGGGESAASEKALPKATLERGKEVYTKVCSVCHDAGQLNAPKLGDKAAWAPLIAKNFDVLVQHSIKGFKGMPVRGACVDCSDTDIIAAVKYMVQQGKTEGDYLLW
jgi:cytochrome c5